MGVPDKPGTGTAGKGDTRMSTRKTRRPRSSPGAWCTRSLC